MASEETVDTVVPPKVKPGKTKVEERVVVEEADNEDIVDSDEIDDNNPDYPDDPTFRGRIEI